MQVGDKVKTKLEQPHIMCSLRERVEFYHWWIIENINDGIYTLKDKNNNIILINDDGYELNSENRYVIYKIKKGVA